MSVFISNLVISPDFGYLDGKLYAFINKIMMVMGFSVTIRLLAMVAVYTLLTSSLNGNAAYKIYSVVRLLLNGQYLGQHSFQYLC